jgi:hypothetical protein
MDTIPSYYLNTRTVIDRCMDGDVNTTEWFLICNSQVTLLLIIVFFWASMYIAIKFVDDLKNEFVTMGQTDDDREHGRLDEK